MSHFLFVAGALRERSSSESAELQLGHGLWGLCTELIRDNLQKYMTDQSCGLVYVLKVGICAEFQILSPAQSYEHLDQLLKDEFRSEARFGFIRIALKRQWASSPVMSQRLLQEALKVDDQVELARRLRLGMHRLTQDEYEAIVRGMG